MSDSSEIIKQRICRGKLKSALGNVNFVETSLGTFFFFFFFLNQIWHNLPKNNSLPNNKLKGEEAFHVA